MADSGQSQVSSKSLNIAIVGGGLVGALGACFLAKRGHNVRLYEFRSDIRVSEEVRGRSINLALSVRGREALREIGLEDDLVHDHSVPMMSRMIHGAEGTLKEIPYDLVNHNCIYSVNRRYLNEALLNAAEKYPNVEYHFKKKLIDADLETGKMIFLNRETETEEHVAADLIVGADGAHSAVRRIMMKRPLFNISQSYIEHGYMEFIIPATKDGNHAMARNSLHIWPRGEFMLIALPNGDGSFTVSFFATFKTFESLKTNEDLLEFFQEYFPDSLPLLGEEKLMDDFFANKPSPLISIKCEPFHVGKTAILIGDAAHAMVPFYGQGMNTGFEDCLLLDGLFEKYKSDVANILPAFSELRCSDAHEICDLAMYNYLEMRDLVNRKSFILRKYLDSFLYWLMPEFWIPLYNSIHFTRMSFKKCRQNFAWQEKVVYNLMYFFGGLFLLSLIAAIL